MGSMTEVRLSQISQYTFTGDWRTGSSCAVLGKAREEIHNGPLLENKKPDPARQEWVEKVGLRFDRGPDGPKIKAIQFETNAA
jgi:hypothetical protein